MQLERILNYLFNLNYKYVYYINKYINVYQKKNKCRVIKRILIKEIRYKE